MAIAVAALIVGGCATPSGPATTASVQAAATVTPLPTSPEPSAVRAPVAVDESLLDHLPDEIDGVPLEFSAEASSQAAGDLDLGARARSVAYAVAGGAPLPDLAIVTVVGLTAEGVDEPAFRDLRDTYDREVCRQWGGVAGNAEAVIDGRTVYIATCAGEGRTYHTLLERSNAVVSVYAAGQARLGEQLMGELRDP